MKTFSFIKLMIEIFKKSPADIEKIQRMGLLAVKIGQMFALRIDFLTPEKCAQLSKLLENNQMVDDVSITQLLTKSQLNRLTESFSSFNQEPFASASVAQVHQATLKTGELVAVKLIKHDYVSTLEKDVNKVITLFRRLIFFYPKLKRVANPVALLEMIREDTLDELDLRNELKHHYQLKEIFNQHRKFANLEKLNFQTIYDELTSQQILVSDFIDGESFESLLSKGKLEYETLLELFHIHGFYIFSIGVFHGDLHPGNIMYSNGKIYFIDCGALGFVSKQLQVGLFHFMKHLSNFEFKKCAASLHEMSVQKLSEAKYVKFEAAFLYLYRDFKDKTVSEVSLTMQMMETIKLGVNFGMSFDKGMFPVIKSLMYLDGMVRRANPQAVLMKDMRRYVEELENLMNKGAI
jgi:ubiquinone biosynthesis protein